MDVDPALALLTIARFSEVDWDARANLGWFPYTFDKGMISVLLATAPLMRGWRPGVRIEEGGMSMWKPEYYGDFASRVMRKEYARKAWKRLTDTGRDLTDLSMLDEQDALMAKVEEVVAAERAVAAVPAVDNDSLLDVKKMTIGNLRVLPA